MKLRLDKLLIQHGHAQSRERAKTLIKSGHVLINGNPVTKTSAKYSPNINITMTAKDIPWVSRAGSKLEKAFHVWPVSVTDKICLDIGSSTGGFTEVLLHQKVKQVYALDVGQHQLAPRLRKNPQVIVMDGRNIREAKKEWFNQLFDFITVDVSYISLKYVLPKLTELLHYKGEAVILIKPQFEIGKEHIHKGVVRDPVFHKEIIDTIKNLSIQEELTPIEVIESPIKGVGGNKEFLVYLKKEKTN